MRDENERMERIPFTIRAAKLQEKVQAKVYELLDAEAVKLAQQTAEAAARVEQLEKEIAELRAQRDAARQAAKAETPDAWEKEYYGSDNWVEKAQQGCAHGPEGL